MTTKSTDWRPNASLEVLKARASMLSQIRTFFQQKQILEVDTPSISHSTITDVYLDAPEVQFPIADSESSRLFLQTSPEFSMKRLLAAGSGSIYQVCRCFRDDERGRIHNPEFLMLEWYHLDYNLHQLMNEMDELLSVILQTKQSERISYQQLFLNSINIDPLTISTDELQKLVNDINGPYLEDKDQLLNCLFVSLIEPKLAKETPLFVHHFPASQASLAKLSKDDPRTAERFELYFQGIELANGFYELQDVVEQRKRFEQDNQQRKNLGKNEKPIDEMFLDALTSGLPKCSGVALGLDRLLMLKLNENSIDQVMPFTFDRA